MSWINRLVPRYGNWGGPSLSGGKYTDDPAEVDWSIPGIDSMDELFKAHDRAYQTALHMGGTETQTQDALNTADFLLAYLLGELSANPRRWDRMPPWWRVPYAIWYRYMVLGIFNIKGRMQCERN